MRQNGIRVVRSRKFKRTPDSDHAFDIPSNLLRQVLAASGPRKAKVALARKLAVTLHAMWRTNTPLRERAMA